MRGEVKRKGFWHEPDALPTSKAIALQVWTPIAVQVLAGRDGRRIVAADLAAQVQELSQVSTSHPVATWMPDLLVLVDHLRAREGDQPLSPLVGAPPPPARAPARRSPSSRPATPRTPTPRRVAKTDRPTATCPRCFMALPATGICDTCD
jgi:hypothetical protein